MDYLALNGFFIKIIWITKKQLLKDINIQFIRQWQSRWNNSEKGRRVYRTVPSIKWVMQSPWFKPNKFLIQFMTGHEDFQSYYSKTCLSRNRTGPKIFSGLRRFPSYTSWNIWERKRRHIFIVVIALITWINKNYLL